MSSLVQVLRENSPLSEARRILTDELFHHLPVLDDEGALVGILSAHDLLRVSWQPGLSDADLDQRFPLKDVMQTKLVTLQSDDPLSRAAELLSTGDFHSLPVIDEGRRLLGMITSTDLIDFLRGQFSSG